MDGFRIAGLLGAVMADEARRASDSDVPEVVIERALKATSRAMMAQTFTAEDCLTHRARAYFRAVVSRSLVRAPGGQRAAARVVLRVAVDELRSAGRSTEDVLQHLERGWRGRVPNDVLDDCLVELCA